MTRKQGGFSVVYDCPNCNETYWAGRAGKYHCEVCGCELEIRDSKDYTEDKEGNDLWKNNSKKQAPDG